MKTLILASAAALALTAPAFAAQVSLGDVEAHFASDFVSNEAKIYDAVEGGTTEAALEIHAGLFAEDESNNGGVDFSASDFRVSTKGVANSVAADIFAQLADESRNHD